MRKILVPDYISSFACIGSECEDTCCAGWQVPVDKVTYQKYRKVTTPVLRKQLDKAVTRNRSTGSSNDAWYAKINLKEGGACPLLDTKGLCSIQSDLGASYLCNTCAVYPRYINKVGDSYEQSLTLSCPQAARIILQKVEGIGFIEQTDEITGAVVKQLSLSDQPYFWDLRIYIIELMQNRKQSIEVRLIILGLFLQRIEEIAITDYPVLLPQIMKDYMLRLDNDAFVQSLMELQPARTFQLDLVTRLLAKRADMGFGNKKYVALLQSIVEGLHLNQSLQEKTLIYQQTYETYYEPFSQEHDYILENYIVNYIFKNLMPYDKSTFQDSYMMLAIHIMLIKLHITGVASVKHELDVSDAVECIYLIGRTIEHSEQFLKFVHTNMVQAEFTTMGHMFSIIK